MKKREYIRLDSIFPVEFQLIDSETKLPLSAWLDGQSADISGGGVCLHILKLDSRAIGLLNRPRKPEVSLKIHIPFLAEEIPAVASISWFKQETNDPLGRYGLGLKYEKISAQDNERIMRASRTKAIIPSAAAIVIVLLFLALGVNVYHNYRLRLMNRRLLVEAASVNKDINSGMAEIENIRKEKFLLENQTRELSAKINSISEELAVKTKSLEQDLNKAEIENKQASSMRQAQIKNLKEEIAGLQNQKDAFTGRISGLNNAEQAQVLKVEGILKKEAQLERSVFDKMYQWLKNHQNPRTGLIASFEGDDSLKDFAFTYDEALSAICFIYFKDYALAGKILDFYAARQEKSRGFYNAYYVSVNEPAEYVVHSGPNIWIGVAALQYSRATGSNKYLPLAKNIAAWIIKLQDEDKDKGLRGGPKDTWFSTEHNLDGFAFFNMLSEITRDNTYRGRARQLQDWLQRHVYDKPDVPVRRGKGDSTIATDTYAWSIAALGVERLKGIGMEPEAIIKFAEDNCSAAVNYSSPAGIKMWIRGFDFTKPFNIARGPVVSTEWTAQMVIAYKILSSYFAANGGAEKAELYQQKAEDYLSQLSKMVMISPSPAGLGGLCLPYASDEFINTGHGWWTPKGKSTGSVAATVYAIFAYYGFNPLE